MTERKPGQNGNRSAEKYSSAGFFCSGEYGMMDIKDAPFAEDAINTESNP